MSNTIYYIHGKYDNGVLLFGSTPTKNADLNKVLDKYKKTANAPISLTDDLRKRWLKEEKNNLKIVEKDITNDTLDNYIKNNLQHTLWILNRIELQEKTIIDSRNKKEDVIGQLLDDIYERIEFSKYYFMKYINGNEEEPIVRLFETVFTSILFGSIKHYKKRRDDILSADGSHSKLIY